MATSINQEIIQSSLRSQSWSQLLKLKGDEKTLASPKPITTVREGWGEVKRIEWPLSIISSSGSSSSSSSNQSLSSGVEGQPSQNVSGTALPRDVSDLSTAEGETSPGREPGATKESIEASSSFSHSRSVSYPPPFLSQMTKTNGTSISDLNGRKGTGEESMLPGSASFATTASFTNTSGRTESPPPTAEHFLTSPIPRTQPKLKIQGSMKISVASGDEITSDTGGSGSGVVPMKFQKPPRPSPRTPITSTDPFVSTPLPLSSSFTTPGTGGRFSISEPSTERRRSTTTDFYIT